MDTGMDMIMQKSLLNVDGGGGGRGVREVWFCHNKIYLIPHLKTLLYFNYPPSLAVNFLYSPLRTQSKVKDKRKHN